MNKVLITGVSGFAGTFLQRFLKEQGYSVFGIDKKPSDAGNFFECDITDKDKVFKIVDEVKPSLVFHLAAQPSVKKSWENPELTEKINVGGTENLLKAVLGTKLNPKILIISSGEVYGAADTPFTESMAPNPNNPYSKSKLAAEELSIKYSKNSSMNIIISRSFSHTGPGQSPGFVCSSFAKQIVEVEKGLRDSIEVGNLDAERDFTDVRDIVKAYLLAVEKCKPADVYNICSGKAISISKILDILINLSTAEIKVKKDPERMRPSDIPEIVGDNTKFTSQTGWNPEIAIEITLKDLLDYWRKEI